MKRLSAISALAMLVLFVFSGCNLVGNLFAPRGTTVSGLSDSLVSFPESLSRRTDTATQSSGTVAPMSDETLDSVIDYVDYVYRPVRNSFNPLAQAAIDVTNELLGEVESAVLSNENVMGILESEGEFSGYNDDETEAYQVTLDTSTGADVYTVQIWKAADGAWRKDLHMQFQESGDGYKGALTIRNTESGAEEGELYQIDFDADDPDYGKLTEVRGVNIDGDDPNDPDDNVNIPTRLWVQAFEQNDRFHVNATIHYTEIQIEDQTAFGSCFMDELDNDRATDNVTASYIYQGIAAASEGEDRGAVSLALVPSNVTGTDTIFTTYAYGEIYKRAIGEWVRSNPQLDSGDDLIPAVNNILGNVTDPAVVSIDDQSDNADIFTALEEVRDFLISDGSSAPDLDAILFVVEVVNPAYYTADGGFVGSDTLNTPTWADELTGSSNPFAGQIDVAADQISSAAFTVTMPENTPPDF